MWGPYNKTPYSRDHARYDEYEISMATEYNTASLLSSSYTILASLACTIIAGARIARIRTYKRLLGQYFASSKVNFMAQITYVATCIVNATMSRICDYNKALAATTVWSANAYKRIIKLPMQAYCNYKTSRLRLEKSLGWDYSGDFAPGDRIKVDRDRLTVTLNGSNVMDLVDGDLPYFAPGPNILTYEDSEGTRQIRIRVLWRGRWI